MQSANPYPFEIKVLSVHIPFDEVTEWGPLCSGFSLLFLAY